MGDWPCGNDGVVVQGINTAGTVGVNNLAQPGSNAHITPTVAEILAVLFGGIHILAA